MSHTFLARIIHGGIELCLLKIFQEILTTQDRKDTLLNHLLLLIEEFCFLPFVFGVFSLFFFHILKRRLEEWEQWQIILEGAVTLVNNLHVTGFILL